MSRAWSVRQPARLERARRPHAGPTDQLGASSRAVPRSVGGFGLIADLAGRASPRRRRSGTGRSRGSLIASTARMAVALCASEIAGAGAMRRLLHRSSASARRCGAAEPCAAFGRLSGCYPCSLREYGAWGPRAPPCPGLDSHKAADLCRFAPPLFSTAARTLQAVPVRVVPVRVVPVQTVPVSPRPSTCLVFTIAAADT